MALAILAVILTLYMHFIIGINGSLSTSTTNAAFKKDVVAEKTCGSPPEKYFASSQNNLPPRFRESRICDASNSTKSHNASYLVDDNRDTFWQSTSMVNRANITIDFSGPMHKYYFVDSIEILFGEFYRPMQMEFQKSTDNGVTYTPWHYYVSEENPEKQCEEKFKEALANKPATVKDVICTQYPERVALPQNQTVEWKTTFLRGKPSNPNDDLLTWMNVTNIRINFLTLNKPYDPLAVLWYHYAVREVTVIAYCDCNGHGVSCNYNKTKGDNMCTCQPGTCGDKCDQCCPAYNHYPWKAGSKGPMVVDESSACQLCNCYNHSNVCHYNETIAKMNGSLNMEYKYSGGGVCQDCQHNTEGVNCEKCKAKFYRPANRSKHSPNVCEECGCNEAGSRNESLNGVLFLECMREEGQNHVAGACLCKNNTEGRTCGRCKPGYYNLNKTNPEGCQVCTCNPSGTVNRSNICEPDVQGQCTCKRNVQGVRCDTCNDTFYGLSHDNVLGCQACLCNYGGSEGPVCAKGDGQCPCLLNIEGRQCERPKDEAYYPDLHFIGGNTQHSPETNSWSTTFNVTTGRSTNSSLFTLLISYQSKLPQNVTVTVTSTETISMSVALDNCSSTCYRNLSEFGEMRLTGMVRVNVTRSVSGFVGKRVIALPKEFYQPDILREGQEDFLGNCSVINNGPLRNLSSEFCKQGVFTITTGYLGKALDCRCDSNGSNNLICEKYGGQCSCKPGVTGRRCDQCQPGFYNLTTSGCTACNCSADDKVCNPLTGQCKCPPNTIGRICDQCDRTFWGWNSTTGCQACNCNLTGCADTQCNLTTGICKCKPGVHLAKCSECKDEYKNFSVTGCSSCDCDLEGSLSTLCDKGSGQCPCKNNTMGLHCSQCKAGTFYLNEPHPKGCTDCICMGITKNCSSTTKNIQQRPLELNLWHLLDEENNKTVEVEQSLKVEGGDTVSVITANVSSAAQRLVWKASNNFTQNSLVTSYNGNLSFILHVTNLSGAVTVANPKVVFKGSHGITIEQTFSSVSIDQVVRRVIFMKETAWVYAGTSTTVSREHFMLVLAKPLSVHVTASLLSRGDGYYKTSFGGVILQDVSNSTGARAYEVEHCQCGPEYTGLSCERCAPSHYRVNVTGDSFLGKCDRCNCNNHTLDCYASSGQCYNCDHNTTGNHCERCLDGFYGNATDGTSSDCKTCPCEAPRTTTSLCTDYYGQPKCSNCSVGYEGLVCDKCQLKYFGRPHLPDGNCSLCQCNNNSDVCNTTTGECKDCSHNTTGFNCERCENGTYGYAPRQNCTGCSCDTNGSYSHICNHRTGQCDCKPHVIERNCSRCEPNSYNFTDSGCMECKCNQFGSSHLQCNETGNCYCKDNVTGIKCDKCDDYFYGLPDTKCKACDCNTTGSNASIPCHSRTGQCICKPGVTGRKCDTCMVMHVNFSSDGCDPCPECARLNLQGTLNNTQVTLEKALNESKQVEKLKSWKAKLNEVNDRISRTQKLVEEFNKRVKELRIGITEIKNNTLNKTIMDLQSQLSAMALYSNTLKQNTFEELNRVRNIKNETDNALQYVRRVEQLTFDISNQLEALKISANQMLAHASTFLKQTFENESAKAESELNKARYVRNTLTRIARHNVTTHRSTAESLNASVTSNERTFNEKLVEFKTIQERNNEVKRITVEVNVLVNETLVLIAQGNLHLSSAGSLLQEVSILLNTSRAEIEYGRNALEESNKVLNDVPGLNSQITKLTKNLQPTEDRIRSANLSVNVNATKHAANLTAEAQLRKNVLDSIADNSKRAVDAIKQYESVVKLVNQSLETSAKVNESLQQIMTRLNNFSSSFSAVEQSAQECYNKSKDVLDNTLARSIDRAGLQRNVSKANETFQRATFIGRQIDMYHDILLSRSNTLIELSEPGAAEHSIYTDLTKAATFKARVFNLAPSIQNNSMIVQDEVSRINASIVYINESSEHASQLMSEAFASIVRGNAALVNVTQSNAQAQTERNNTADLTTQLKTNMERLKLKLREAREKIAKIQHALKIHGNTTLQYTPTGRITQKTLNNDISLDFKAERNQVIQGPLVYLAEGLNDTDSSLFLSLVYNQYVSFTYNLGSGPISVVNYAVPIRTGNWYRIYASRIKAKARLTVTNYRNNISRTYEASTNQIMPKEDVSITSSSPFFLGSLPDNVLPNVTRRFFYGCIDNVVVNQQRVGLWDNTTKVTGNRFACSKCLDSAFSSGFDDIIPGTSFYGSLNTYLIQSMGTFNISSTSEIMFQFRTFHTGAIINVMQSDLDYLYGIYLNSGRVVFYFKNGSVLHSLVSNKTNYNNGRWYEVHVTRGLINSTLVIKDVDSQEMDVSSLTLSSPLVLPEGLKLIFGSKDPQSPFEAPMSAQFAGDIRYIRLSSNTNPSSLVSRSLSDKNLTQKSDEVNTCGILRNVEPPIRFIGKGYAGLHTGFSNMSKLSIKFKTLNPSGILVYSGDVATNHYFYLALFHGNLFLINTREPDSKKWVTTSRQTLNDGAFHTVDITFFEAGLQLVLDRAAQNVRLSPGAEIVVPGPVKLNGTLFIGGVKSPSSISLVNVPVVESLVGAMEYVDVNGRRQNIFSGESKEVSLAGSSPERRVLPTPKPTILPTTEPPPSCGVRLPDRSLSREPDEVKFGANPMYIGFWLERSVLDYMKHQHVITLNFRSLSPNGVLLYATDNLTAPTQFLSIELVNGRLVFKFNTGAGLVRVQSYHNNYSSGGVWYKAHFLRIDQFGGLLVPLTRDYNNKRNGDATKSLLLNSPLFLGGVPKATNTSMLEAVDKNGEAISFMGCMSSLEISSANATQTKKLNPKTDYDANNTKITNASCYKYVQPQVSFGGSSYILLYENYTLPNSLDVIMRFRTYIRSGLLWVLTNNTGSGAVTLEQYQGQIILKFISDSNQTTMVWTDPSIPADGRYNASYILCDNKFHSVRVQQSGSTVKISVDQHEMKTFALNEGFSLTGKFYVGGVPDGAGHLSHLGSSKVRLEGCIQSLTINSKLIDLIRGPVSRDGVGVGCRSPPIPVLSSPPISVL